MRDRLTDQRIAAVLTDVVAALSAELACGEIRRRSTEEPVANLVGGQQQTDFFFQPLVAAGCVAKKRVALCWGHVECRLQQLIDVSPAFGIHLRASQSVRDTARLLPSSIRTR